MSDIFEEDLFGDSEPITPQQPVDDARISDDEEDEIPFGSEEGDEEGVVPTAKEKPLTNLEFLSRMLHSSLRNYLREYQKWLRHKFSDKLLDTFLDIASKMEEEDVTPEILGAILPDLGVDDLRKDIIVNSYRLVYEDTSKCLLKVTYEKFREIVYREYFDSVKNNNAVETIEKIQNSEFFLPPYGAVQNDTFQQLKFGEFDMSSIMEDLGSPLYSHFPDINNTSPIKGYIPSQVTMVAGQLWAS